jgi:hypothetical protein
VVPDTPFKFMSTLAVKLTLFKTVVPATPDTSKEAFGTVSLPSAVVPTTPVVLTVTSVPVL